MKKYFLYPLRGIVVLILYVVCLLLLASLVLLTAFVVWVIPLQTWRQYWGSILQKVPVWWMDLNNMILQLHARGKLDVQGTGHLDPKGWYMMISNHRSWTDILIISSAFHRKLPFLKFFMKQELLWQLPIAGLGCYVLGYPFLSRHTPEEVKKNPSLKGKDIATVKKACNKFKEFPTTVISFAEGTRYTRKKQLQQNSPYQYLLKPKTAGTAVVLRELQPILQGLVNVTLLYKPEKIGLWDFVCGNFEKLIVRYEVLPITPELVGNYYEDRTFRASFQQQLNKIWAEKDQLIDQLTKTE